MKRGSGLQRKTPLRSMSDKRRATLAKERTKPRWPAKRRTDALRTYQREYQRRLSAKRMAAQKKATMAVQRTVLDRRIPRDLCGRGALKYEPMEKFMLLVAKDDGTGCWVWTGGRNRDGFGLVRFGKNYLAHRWIYEQRHGRIPPKLQVRQMCDNQLCVNPDHLDAVTQRTNAQQWSKATATHCKHGHEYTPENTYRDPSGGRRRCRECKRIAMHKTWAKDGPGWSRGRVAGTGPCIYCGTVAKLTFDHVVPRSLYYGPDRHDDINLVKACWPCNSGRSSGYKPPWLALPSETRDFVLRVKSEVFARRYFSWLDEPAHHE